MKASVPQLILDFEPPVGTREDDASLQIFGSEQEYFAAAREQEGYKVKLPRPFQETALMDDGGWKQHPREAWGAKDLGERMWLNLPESVRDSILSGEPGNPQRVGIMSTHCGMDDVPWEWITDGEQPIAANDSVRFYRIVPARYPAPPLRVSQPVRVLIVLSDPKGKEPINPVVETDVITDGFKENSAFEFQVLLEASFESVTETLKAFSPHIIHYVGPAGVSGSMGNLLLHDRKGTRWVSAAECARFLPSSVRLLCLSTCVTGKSYEIGGLSKFAHCTPEVSLPTTLVNQYALQENSARTFWRQFYPALVEFKGDAVESLHKARMAVFVEEKETWCWASFSMIVRDGSGQCFQIGEAKSRSAEQYSKDLQAQWAARAANTLATRMRSLGPDNQSHWQSTLDDEVERAQTLESQLDSEEESRT